MYKEIKLENIFKTKYCKSEVRMFYSLMGLPSAHFVTFKCASALLIASALSSGFNACLSNFAAMLE